MRPAGRSDDGRRLMVVPESMPSHATALPDERIRPSRSSRLLSFLTQPRGLGFAVAAVGAIGIISSLTPELPARLELVEDLVDPVVVHFAAGTTALIGFVLLLLGRGLARRRRSAYFAALVLLLLSAVSHLVKGLDVEEAALAVGVMLLLVRAREQFTVPLPPGRVMQVVRVAIVLVVADLGIGVAGLALGASRLRVPFKPGKALIEVAHRLGGAEGAVHFHGVARLFPLALAILGFLSVAVLLVVAFAPARAVDFDDEPRERVRRLLDRPDGDTLDPFALRADKQYVFSGDGRAAIAYRCVAGVGLASGDPVGEPASFPDALAQFVAHCEARGWRPAVMGARSDRLDVYLASGMRAQYLGDEAIVDVASFTLDGRVMRGVRQAVNRTRNFGITTEVCREGELADGLRSALLDIAERGRNGAPERGFSMALDQLLSGRDADCVVAVARDAEGVPIAFQRYAPCKAGTGLSLDAMRRDDAGPNGVNERLIVDTIEWARALGVHEVSLNFAFCKDLIDDEGCLSTGQRAQAWVVRRLNPYFQIESLLRFNAKFGPRWVPRYLVYGTLGDLAVVGAAAASAEGFLPFDRRHGWSPAMNDLQPPTGSGTLVGR